MTKGANVRYCIVTICATMALCVAAPASGVSVSSPHRVPHPRVARLVAERNAAVRAGDLVLARSVELLIQEKLEELHPLPRTGPARIQVKLAGEQGLESFDPDVLIDTCRILSTAADYELGGAMYACGSRSA